MNLGVIIDVAIGVVFVWLVISLSAIQIQEWIASGLKFRERDLEKAIGKMLANPQLTKELYNHPLISSFAKKPGGRPTYIPPREFTQALFNIITTAGTENSAIQQKLASIRIDVVSKQLAGIVNRNEVREQLDLLIEQAGSLVATQTSKVLDKFIALPAFSKLSETEGIKEVIADVPNAVQTYLDAIAALGVTNKLTQLTPEQIEAGITALGKLNPKLERSLKSMVTGVGSYVTAGESSLAAARGNFESWFNNSMESLSGLYKRRSQWISFGIGLFLSITLSVDSIALVQKLWVDPTVRAVLVENAGKFEMPTTVPTTIPTSTPIPNASGEIAPVTPSADTTATSTPPPSPADTIRNFQLQFEGLELPMGWTSSKTPDGFKCVLAPRWVINVFSIGGEAIVIQGFSSEKGTFCHRPVGTTVPDSSEKTSYLAALQTDWIGTWFLGVLITALATVQGAQFWFDMLKNLINLRGAGARPPTTTENKPQK